MPTRTSPPPVAPKMAPKALIKSTSTASPTQAMTPPVEPMKKPHERKLMTGHEYGLEKVSFPPFDKIKSFSDLAQGMAKTTAGARDIGEAVEVVKAMVADKSCFRVLTLSGNATPFNSLISELVDRKIVNCIVSTGSVITHSFSFERGRPLLIVPDPDATDDSWLYNRGGNRIFDTLELEESLNEGYEALGEITDSLDPDEYVGSADITSLIGKYLNEKFPKERGFLHSAERAGVSVIIPSFTDCEIGLDFHAQNLERRKEGEPEIFYDAFADVERYYKLIREAKSIGLIELGGGVPRNWAQQIGPFADILTEKGLEPKSLIIRVRYAIRLCSAPATEGGLSGCSFSEGRSWGKFLQEEKGGKFAEVIGDYSLGFPLICAAILEGAQ